MNKIVATKIKETDPGKAIYELSRPVEYNEHDDTLSTKYVVISAVDALISGPETYIFPSDKEGGIIYWSALHGSYKGGLDHETAIKYAGWVPHLFQ